jgi:hypothetical protein
MGSLSFRAFQSLIVEPVFTAGTRQSRRNTAEYENGNNPKSLHADLLWLSQPFKPATAWSSSHPTDAALRRSGCTFDMDKVSNSQKG